MPRFGFGFGIGAPGFGGPIAPAVTNLTATVQVDRSVVLNWTDAPGVASYDLSRQELDASGNPVGSPVSLGNVLEGVQTFHDTF